MNLVNYIKSLIPTFKKDELLDSCSITKQTIEENTFPVYEQAAELFKSKGFTNKKLGDFVKEYSSNVIKVTDKTIIPNIRDVIDKTITLLETIEDTAKKEISASEASLALTYKKSTLLRLVQTAEYMSVYSRKLLNYIYIAEAYSYDNSPSVNAVLTKMEIDFVENGFINFCTACRVLETASKNFARSYKDIPEAVISDLSEVTLPNTVGNYKLDPFLMNGFIDASVVWSPFYLIGMMIAQYQASVFKKNQAELTMLELRLFNLKKLIDGEPDAALQKEIQYTQSRVDDLEYKIHKAKEDYNV